MNLNSRPFVRLFGFGPRTHFEYTQNEFDFFAEMSIKCNTTLTLKNILFRLEIRLNLFFSYL